MKTSIISILLCLAQFSISFSTNRCNLHFLMNHCNADQAPDIDLCTCIECKDACDPNIPKTGCALQHKELRCMNYTDGPSGELKELQGDDPSVLRPKPIRPSNSLLDEKNNEKKGNEGKSNDQILIPGGDEGEKWKLKNQIRIRLEILSL